MAENVAIDMFGNSSTSKTFNDRTQKLERRVTDTPDSTIDGLAISVNGLLQSSRSTTDITTEFRYDALGRQSKRIDQRTGPSLTHYNDKGQVDYVIAAPGERTDFTYNLDTGQKIAETNALGKTTRFAYNLQGQITYTWGDVPYPVFLVLSDTCFCVAVLVISEAVIVIEDFRKIFSGGRIIFKTMVC